MSLLMDALKKAELAKRRGQADGAAASAEVAPEQGGLSLEPLSNASSLPNQVPAPPSAGSGASADNLPHLPSHLEELDAQFLAEAKQAASARLKASQASAGGREPASDQTPAKEAPARIAAAAQARAPAANPAPRESVQNLFNAKQTGQPPARKSFAIAIGVLTVVAVCGIGGYFWWQLQPKVAPIASRAPLTPAPTAAAQPAAIPASPASAPNPVAAASAIAPPASTPAPGATTKANANKDDDDGPKPSAQARQQTPARGPNSDQDSLVRVTRAPLKVNPALLRGFDAFNRGDLALAQLEYERAQKAEPRNTDVLHGLAAIAMRQGRLDQAEWLYRQITEADPQDTVAIVALINARGPIDPGAAESRLKSLSAAQPELAAPHFSLGNLYARHSRWADAQQAYFRAYTAEPDNPDILYNLAISLEHLRQNKLAAQYYGQAIAAAQNKPAGFDKAQAAARQAALQH
jgi:Flp pilus assembly protein TadD